MDYFFYHLSHQAAYEVVPRLVHLCRERQWRVIIRARQPETLRQISDALWAYGEGSFLAHAQAGDLAADYSAQQPIWLTLGDDSPNALADIPQVEILLEDQRAPDPAALQRAIYIFDGADPAALAAARQHWRDVKEAGACAISYWQQSPDGQWTQQA